MRISSTAPFLAAAAAAIGLAGCGGSSQSRSSRASAAVTTTVTRTATTPASSSSASSTSATITGAGSGSLTSGSGTATSGSGGGAVAPQGTTTSAAGGPPPCRASGLALSFLGGQGATGHGLLGFVLRNTGGSSCATGGYPGVQFLAASGAPLPTHPTHTTDDFFGHTALRPLAVGPGQSVSFRLGVSHGGGSAAGCATVHALGVIPPNDTATLRVDLTGGAYECGGTVTVSPLQPGTSAYR